MPNVIGYKDLSNLYIKPAAEPTRTISDIDLKSASEPERVLNPIVSESYMRQYIEEHGGITPTGNIEITENTTEPLDIAQYATATVNVSGGGDSMLKTTLTVVNNTNHLVTLLPIEMRTDCFLLNNNVVNIPINTEGAIILDGSNMPEIELQSSQTMTLDLYYCVSLGAAPSTGIKFTSTDAFTVSNVVNFTYNSEFDAYLVTDLSIDSSITVTLTPSLG